MPSSEARYVEVRLFKGKFLMFIIIRCHQFDVIFPEKLTLNELVNLMSCGAKKTMKQRHLKPPNKTLRAHTLNSD